MGKSATERFDHLLGQLHGIVDAEFLDELAHLVGEMGRDDRKQMEKGRVEDAQQILRLHKTVLEQTRTIRELQQELLERDTRPYRFTVEVTLREPLADILHKQLQHEVDEMMGVGKTIVVRTEPYPTYPTEEIHG